jgi:peptidoglycan biosynthesis protein MviN/MurJ (putative lipid II flippase)
MAALVVLALLGAAAGIVFLGITTILSNSFYAMQRIAVPMVVMPLGTVIFFFATKYLSETYGIFGLALANSVVAGTMAMVMAFALAFILPKFSATTLVKRIVLYLVPAAIGGFAGLELATFMGLNGLSRLIVSFAVLLITYTAVLWMTRETTFVRVSRSVHMAIG